MNFLGLKRLTLQLKAPEHGPPAMNHHFPLKQTIRNFEVTK